MSQAMLELILDELRNFRSEFDQKFEAIRSEFKAEIQSVKKDQQTILTRLNSHEKMYAQLIGMVKSVKETVADIASMTRQGIVGDVSISPSDNVAASS